MNYFGKRILYNSNDSFSNTNRCRYQGHTYCLWNTHRMLVYLENKILIEDMYTSSWKIKHCLKHCVTHTCISYLRIHKLRGYDASIKHFFLGVSTLRKPIKEQNTLYRAKQFISITKINTAFPKCTRRSILWLIKLSPEGHGYVYVM